MRLLVVEDESRLAGYLVRGLREEGYAVDLAGAVAEARDLAIANEYDLVVLDLMLPDGSGLELLQEWRAEGQATPVLVLTARDTVRDKVSGLDHGADDYLTKPFDFAELLARVRSLLRRRQTPPQRWLRFHELSLEREGRSAEVAGRALELTAKELALLEFFLLHPGRVLSRTVIAEHVWDDSFTADSNVIEVLVGRLRRKIAEAGGRRLLHTVKGLGYLLREPDAEEA